MREIQRTIVAAFIWSKDKKLLMGKKDLKGGGVFADCRHMPGGGLEVGESLEDGLKREVQEEVGIDISKHIVIELTEKNQGTAEKILKETGEKVLCHMNFNYFKVLIDKNAYDIKTNLSDDLINIERFNKEELENIKQIPGGKEFFQKLGILTKLPL